MKSQTKQMDNYQGQNMSISEQEKQQYPPTATNSYLSPQYLLSLSSHLQTLSSFYVQQNMPSISTQYKSFLTSTFKNLSNHLNLFHQDQIMIISSLLSTRFELQLFLLEKLFFLFQKQSKSISQILKFLFVSYRQNQQHYEQLLIRERKRKVQVQNQKVQRVVQSLKKQVLIKRDYVKDLEERIRDLEEENSSMYQKLIQNAKNTISNTLIQSKVLANSSQLLLGTSTSKLSKIIANPSQNNIAMSPSKPAHQSHKKLSLKQVQETILQILTLKRKQQSISMKRQSMQSYIKYYFKYKFGLNDLYEQMKNNFLSALSYFLNQNNLQSTSKLNEYQNHQDYGPSSRYQQTKFSSPVKRYLSSSSQNRPAYRSKQSNDQKPLLLVFYKILHEQIDQQYFWKQYSTKGQRIMKIFKRYINQKQKIQFKQLDRIYDGTGGIAGFISNYSSNKIQLNQYDRKDFFLQQIDVKNLLVNIYKTNTEIETLQMIFSELLTNLIPHSTTELAYYQQTQRLTQTILLSQSSSNQQIKIPSKLLFNTILCYQIQLYSLKITSMTKTIKKYFKNQNLEQSSTGYSYPSLENIILELGIKQQRYLPYLEKHYEQIKNKEFTFSEIVEIMLYELGWNQSRNSSSNLRKF